MCVVLRFIQFFSLLYIYLSRSIVCFYLNLVGVHTVWLVVLLRVRRSFPIILLYSFIVNTRTNSRAPLYNTVGLNQHTTLPSLACLKLCENYQSHSVFSYCCLRFSSAWFFCPGGSALFRWPQFRIGSQCEQCRDDTFIIS